MGLKISDMMDHVENIQIEIGEKNVASVERIKEKTMKKVHDAKANLPTAGKFSRMGVIAAVMAAILCVSAAAAAVVKWGGFALTGSMSAAEIEALLNEAETARFVGICRGRRDGPLFRCRQQGNPCAVC